MTRLFVLKLRKDRIFHYTVNYESGISPMLNVSNLSLYQDLIFHFWFKKCSSLENSLRLFSSVRECLCVGMPTFYADPYR